MNIPSAMLSLVGGNLLGILKYYVTAKMEHNKAQQDALLSSMKANNETREQVMNGPTRGWREYQWTRRVIALTVVFGVFLIPKIAALFFDVPIIYSWVESVDGFLFFDGSAKQHWTIMTGLVISPVDIHAGLAIIGMYFGAYMPTKR